MCVHLLISTYVEANPAGDDSASLEVLFFFSGVDKVSLTGLPYKPKLKFNPTSLFPTASTCLLELTLPTQLNNSYDTFKRNFPVAFKHHGGFGLT